MILMEIITTYKGFTLIQKYGRYYIRFMGGQYEGYPCDLLITNEEASMIQTQKDTLKTVLNTHKKQMKWTKETFVYSGLKDYLSYECGFNEATIQSMMVKLNAHKDIQLAFYETIMYEKFPTGKEFHEYAHPMTITKSYLFRIWQREHCTNSNGYTMFEIFDFLQWFRETYEQR